MGAGGARSSAALGELRAKLKFSSGRAPARLSAFCSLTTGTGYPITVDDATIHRTEPAWQPRNQAEARFHPISFIQLLSGVTRMVIDGTKKRKPGRLAFVCCIVAAVLFGAFRFAAWVGTDRSRPDLWYFHGPPRHWSAKWFDLGSWICAGLAPTYFVVAAFQFGWFRWRRDDRATNAP